MKFPIKLVLIETAFFWMALATTRNYGVSSLVTIAVLALAFLTVTWLIYIEMVNHGSFGPVPSLIFTSIFFVLLYQVVAHTLYRGLAKDFELFSAEQFVQMGWTSALVFLAHTALFLTALALVAMTHRKNGS